MEYRLTVDDLEYKKSIYDFGLAMHAAFYKEPQDDQDKQKTRFWIGQIFASSRENVAKKIEETKKNYEEQLSSSPILFGLLESYIDATKTASPEDFKKIYSDFQNLQKEYPFDANRASYVDAGCYVTADYGKEKALKLMYPVYLATAYMQKGGLEDETRGGYFYPKHVLTNEEIEELYKIDPRLFLEDEDVKEVYNELQGSQPGNR